MRKRAVRSMEGLRVALLSSMLVAGFDATALAREAATSDDPGAVNEDPPGVTREAPSSAEDVSKAKGQDDSAGVQPQGTIDKRIFGIIPNYRTSPSLKDYEPLTTHEKFKIASEDAFDRGTFVLAGVFAADADVTHSDPSFGDGAKGFGHYFGAAYADFVIGDYLTEAVFPSLLHQDPRYFRRGTGGVWSRLGYAMGQIFRTHTDSGREAFNYSEVVGSAVGVAISSAYYPEHRNASSAMSRVSAQIGVDMAANIVKEFAPDLTRKFSRVRHHRSR